MAEFLIVPAASLDRFSGTYSDLAALDPRLLTNGDGVLPLHLLKIEEIVDACPHLERLEVREVADSEFAAADVIAARRPKRTRLMGRLTDADAAAANLRIQRARPQQRLKGAKT